MQCYLPGAFLTAPEEISDKAVSFGPSIRDAFAAVIGFVIAELLDTIRNSSSKVPQIPCTACHVSRSTVQHHSESANTIVGCKTQILKKICIEPSANSVHAFC
mmetsp:Transcript_17933/g.35022  ORF Transcript_17933/g.35022 Transcript_17933/m.35022 type:complete len:103 (+) Transcript_17933:356-664(+)